MWKDFPAIFLHLRQKEHFTAGGEYGHIRDTLQLSQDIYRSGAEESASETKVHCVHEPDL